MTTHINVEQFTEGRSLSALNNMYFTGGKGINVSRVLKNLHVPTKALALIGGFTGDFIFSEAKDIVEPILIKDLNRINTKIKTQANETEIHGIAPQITQEKFSSLCNRLTQIGNIDVLILSGLIPSSLAPDSYKKLAAVCSSTTKIIIDTRGEPLKECLSLDSIFLIKPNKDESSEFFDCEVSSNEEVFFLFDDHVYFAESLKGTLISSVGSGDLVVAGFTAKYYKSQNPLEAFKYGIACCNEWYSLVHV